MCKVIDPELSRQLRDITLRIYKKAADYARQRGIIIADTKFEFGQTPKASRWRMKCLHRIPLASGQPTRISRARRRIPMTSSMYGITSKKFAGTNNRPRCPSPGSCAADE